MSREHWFDTVNKLLTQDTPHRGIDTLSRILVLDAPRRTLLGVAATVVSGLVSNDPATEAAGKRKRKHKQKQRKPKKPNRPRKPKTPTVPPIQPPPQPPSPSEPPSDLSDCIVLIPSELASTEEGRREWEEFCRDQHAHCPGDLCTYRGPGEQDRNTICCPSPKSCCSDGCFDLRNDPNRCGHCSARCSERKVCVDNHCICGIPGACDQSDCWEHQTLCGDECVNTLTDSRHCGGCNAFNPNGLKCCNGNLCHYIDGWCCDETCYPYPQPGLECSYHSE